MGASGQVDGRVKVGAAVQASGGAGRRIESACCGLEGCLGPERPAGAVFPLPRSVRLRLPSSVESCSELVVGLGLSPVIETGGLEASLHRRLAGHEAAGDC